MTPQQIKDNAPDGATHFDDLDYWKQSGDKWFVWLESRKQWRQIFSHEIFHKEFPVKPL